MRTFHSLAWIGWLGTALVALSTTRNPLYLALLLLCIAMVNLTVAAGQAAPLSMPVSPIKLALVVIPLSALFNGLTVHFGDTTLLRFPRDLPVVGGPITLEALAFGLLNGSVLAGILVAFSTVNQALPVRALVRLIPQAFYPVAVVVSIGLTFVPVTTRQFQQIREAQALRGHRMRGVRDWLPLFMSLLISGLERALQLAEAMTARGFASAPAGKREAPARAAIVAGLLMLLVGWLLRLVWGIELPGVFLMVAGAALVLGAIWVVGRGVSRTSYRPDRWTRHDSLVVLLAMVPLAAFSLPVLDRASIFYYPYPKLSLPAFDPIIGVAALGFLGPALLLSRTSRNRTAGRSDIL
jgi:energy-coupling factor transport system permease protein